MPVVLHPEGIFHTHADHIGSVLQTQVYWDNQITPFLGEDPAGWAIDIGANIGFFSVYLARRYQRVIAVEAHPATAALLRATVAANQLSHSVEVIEAAAYDTHGTLQIATEQLLGWPTVNEQTLEGCGHPASVAFVPAAFPGAGGLSVPTVVLDAVIAPTAPIRVIKVDAQGCDLAALRGLSLTIHRCRPTIVWEYEEWASRWHGAELADYLGFFEQIDYTCTRIRADLGDYVARPR